MATNGCSQFYTPPVLSTRASGKSSRIWVGPLRTTEGVLTHYFATLASHHVLTGNQNTDFKRTLAYPRNRYLHEAGATPSNLEANRILNEMHDCLVVVLQKT